MAPWSAEPAALRAFLLKHAPEPRDRRQAGDERGGPRSQTLGEIPRGVTVVLVVTRKTNDTCATDIHFTLPDGTRVDRKLPLGSPVEIPLTIDRAGSITYACGMDMIHGALDVQ